MPLNVLIIENEVLVGWHLQSIIEEAGHVVCSSAMDMAKAVALAHETRPDVAVLDADPIQALPVVETARTLRERYGIPVIFVTGRMLDSEFQGMIAGVEPLAIISKPFTEEGVLSAIDLVGRHAFDHTAT